MDSPSEPPPVQACPYCDFEAPTVARVHRHLAKRHKARPLYVRFDVLRDALHGTPQCTHCLTCLAQWTGLIHHIEHANCPSFDAARPRQVPLCDQPVLRALIVNSAWSTIVDQDDYREALRSTCVLCGRHFRHGQGPADPFGQKPSQPLVRTPRPLCLASIPTPLNLDRVGHVELPSRAPTIVLLFAN